jgi:hypothetical protein
MFGLVDPEAQIMTTTREPQATAASYLAAWNETDDARRRAL